MTLPFENVEYNAKFNIDVMKKWALGKILLTRFEFMLKVGCVFSAVIVSVLSHAEVGPSDHREDAGHFTRSRLFSAKNEGAL